MLCVYTYWLSVAKELEPESFGKCSEIERIWAQIKKDMGEGLI